MARGPTAKRYGQALFALAEEQGREEVWLSDLQDCERLLADREVQLFLTTPRVPAVEKLRAVRELLSGKDAGVVSTIGLLIKRQSIGLLPGVVREYHALLDAARGRVQVLVTSAVPISGDQEARLRNTLGRALDKDVVLDVREDPSIIGGLLVRIGDQIIDGSVRTRLNALRQRLAQESLS